MSKAVRGRPTDVRVGFPPLTHRLSFRHIQLEQRAVGLVTMLRGLLSPIQRASITARPCLCRCISSRADPDHGPGARRLTAMLSAVVGIGAAATAYSSGEEREPAPQHSAAKPKVPTPASPAVPATELCTPKFAAAQTKLHDPSAAKYMPDATKLPMYTLEQVRADHDGAVWVIFEGGVYDVTQFLDAHPGGPHRVMMVAGSDLAAFWDVYSEIHSRPHIRQLLETYRIGNISADDMTRVKRETAFSDAYGDDPVRPRAAELRIPSTRPWNSEPQPHVLTESFYTPNDLFFVRNHNPVPHVDGGDWELEIESNTSCGLKSRTYTLTELKTKFRRVEVVSVMQCAGNRQEDFVGKDRPLYVAPHWRNGAIGCAKWAGVRVRDLLGDCGMDVDGMALGKVEHKDAKIVNFIAEDADETGVPYAGVLPIGKVIDPFGDAILAYEMNGEELPPDHGFPVRLVAPGHAGCRNVKWVRTIAVSKQASELDSGSKLDRHFSPDIGFLDQLRWGEEHFGADSAARGTSKGVRLDQGPVIQTLPVQSVISSPADRSVLSGDREVIELKGVAWSWGGRGVCRVEVSLDGGKNFVAAEIAPPPIEPQGFPRGGAEPQCGQGHIWAWQQWSKTLPLPAEAKSRLREGKQARIEVVARAIDGDFNAQPEKVEHVWNVLGICVNHWPRIFVTLDPKVRKGHEPAPPEPPRAGSPMPDLEPLDE